MTIADSIERVVRYVLDNLTSLTVNRISSRHKHDLALQNGAGASIRLSGATVYINGVAYNSAGIGIGSWIPTDCLWTLPIPIDLPFANTAWGNFSGMYWTGDHNGEAGDFPAGTYVHGFEAAKTSLVSVDKIFNSTTLAQILLDSAVNVTKDVGSYHQLMGTYRLYIVDVAGDGSTAQIELRDGAVTVLATWIAAQESTQVYTLNIGGLTAVPVLAVKFGAFIVGTPSAVEIDYAFQIDSTLATEVNLTDLGAYLILENPLDLRNNDIERIGSLVFGTETESISANAPDILYESAGDHHFKSGGATAMEIGSPEISVSVPIDMNSNAISGIPTPVNDDEAANKAYVDLQAGGGVTVEFIQDTIGAMVVNGDSSMQITYDDDNNQLLLYATAGGATALGTANESFTIDEDNVSGTAALTTLRFNRGYDDAYAYWKWHEASERLVAGKLEHGDATAYTASVQVSNIYIGSNGIYISDDGTGNLVFHVPSGKGIRFERDA